MNDDFSITDEQLELATSRRLPPDSALEGELAAVHASFLAVGESLERAGGNVDEKAILLSVQKRLEAEANQVSANIPVLELKTLSLTPVGWIAMALCVAAAVLIALSSLPRSEESVEVAQQPIVKTEPRMAAEAREEVVPGSTPLTWNDPIDDEIALAAATLNQWSTSTGGVDTSLRNMNNELSALSEELLSESL